MFALTYDEYGPADVLSVGDVPEVHAGPGQIRVEVVASSVNPIDWKMRAGHLKDFLPATFPVVPGVDAAGVVDEVGDGVEGVAVGDEVFGVGSATNAQYAVLDGWALKPEGMSWSEAAGAGLAVETAARALDDLGVGEGSTLLVEGASGGVGSAAVQLARQLGATVIGTASEGNHDFLRSLGATPTTYGPGLAERVAALGLGPVTAVLDAAGSGSITELVTLVDDPKDVVSIADYTAAAHGARVVRSEPRELPALQTFADGHARGAFRVEVNQVLSLEQAAQAHAVSETGHVRGKIVLAVRPGFL